ncbi:MAG: hypothetical protein LC804_27195 [Acidobacteria bacterium]|nr:hypothetical protein [Acidobacteriota bacterium]
MRYLDVTVPLTDRLPTYPGNPTFELTPNYVFLTEAGANYLVEQGVKVIGVDYLSVEEFKKPGAPAHRALLGAGTIIIEGLDLSQAEAGMYEMFCLPLRVGGGDGAPARVILRK